MTDFEVTDSHQHYGNPFDSMGGLGSMGEMSAEEYDSIELARRLETMDSRGVAKTVIIAGHGYLRPNGVADTRRVNDGVIAYLSNAPDRFVAAVGVAEPLYGSAGIDEIDRCKEMGMVGISMHGRFQGVSHDAPWVHRYVERMGEVGLVPYMHAPAGSPEEALWKTEQLALDFPDLPMLVLDAFSGFEECRQAVYTAERCPNLMFETSIAFDFHFIKPTVDRCGPERVAYGSDLYSWPSGEYGNSGVTQILEADLDDAAKSAILSGNVRRLLNLG